MEAGKEAQSHGGESSRGDEQCRSASSMISIAFEIK